MPAWLRRRRGSPRRLLPRAEVAAPAGVKGVDPVAVRTSPTPAPLLALLAGLCLSGCGGPVASLQVAAEQPGPAHPAATADAGEPGIPGPQSPDGGSSQQPPGPPHLAGSYQVANLDFSISQRLVRDHAVAPDAAHGGYLVSWVDASGEEGFRLRAQTVRFPEGPQAPWVGPALGLDDPLPGTHYSAVHGLAGGSASTGGLFLVAFRGFRPVGPGGKYVDWIYGQLFRARADGGLERVGQNFLISGGSDNESQPCVAWDDHTDTFLVAWSSAREHASREDGWILLAREISPDGRLGPELRLGGQERGQVGCSAEGGGGRFLVAWHEYVPTGGLNFDTRYRVRFVSGGEVGPEIPGLAVGMVFPDPPAVAYDARADEWLVVHKVNRVLRGSIWRPDGTARLLDQVVAAPSDGAGVPQLAYSERTHSYLLTWHAWDSTDASAQELDPDGTPAGEPLPLNALVPPNGTYFTPVAASPTDSEFLVVMMKDYARLHGTLLRAPQSLP
jgi:hypothetical protein